MAAAQAQRTPGVPIAPLVYDDSQPVLPPRTTARQQAVVPERAWWKSWPIVVIVLASAAIIVALVLLLWPPHKDEGQHLDQSPASDHMNTNPEMQPGGPPPSTGGSGSAAPDPWQGKTDPDKHTNKLPPPDPVPPTPPADPDDDTFGLGGLGAGTTGGGLGGLGSVGMMGAMIQHGCARMSACSTDKTVQMTCSQLEKALGRNTQVPTCAAAQRCLDKLDKLDCDLKVDDLAKILGLQSNLEDCVDAMQC